MFCDRDIDTTGAFSIHHETNGRMSTNSDLDNYDGIMKFDFDASRSNSIYSSSTTVQPRSMEVKFYIKYL